MDLVPCNEEAREQLAASLFELNDGAVNKKSAVYVAKTFPSILLDVARYLTEKATENARDPHSTPAQTTEFQLKPFFMFSLLLGKSPQISGLMYSYFENSSFQPLPENMFITVLDETKSHQIVQYSRPGLSDELVKEILLSYFKYLTFNTKWFSAVWNWSELGRLMTVHLNHDIRYLSACCLSAITKPSRIQHINFMREIIGSDNYQTLLDLQIKHRHMFSNTFRPCIETRREKAEEYANAVGYSRSGYNYCSDSLAKIGNILLVKRDTSFDEKLCKSVIDRYIPVAVLNDATSRIAYAISINKPCIVRGPSGSGKTAVLDYIAAQTNRLNPPEYVKVQIGDQVDSKLLIGSYVCTEIPGQFEWQPGPLTRAMAYGSWIVFEDIDSAPLEMAQVIHSVIENRNLSCVSSCPIKLDNPHPDFRILFTQKTTQASCPEALKLGFGFVERLCDIVDLPELTDMNLKEIIATRYKFDEQLSKAIVQLFTTSVRCLKNIGSARSVRNLSMRDLFKFCDRIKSRNLKMDMGKFSQLDLDIIFLDAIDCFIYSLPNQYLKEISQEVGQILNKPSNAVEQLLFLRSPNISVGNDSFSIGRTNLKYSKDSTSAFKITSNLGYTKQSLKLVESTSICINAREPVLLVGETGVGKTSIVQHIANLTKNELVVINLSQQSDSADLLGGFRPVEMREIVKPLHDNFVKLVHSTYDAEKNDTFLRHVETSFAAASSTTQWRNYLRTVSSLCANALAKKSLPRSISDKWKESMIKSMRLSKRILSDDESSPMALAFSEGTLLRSIKKGNWILLDEINLAEPEVLQCLILLLDSTISSQLYMLNSSDDFKPIQVHPNFRIFACMNPATDIGKKELMPGIRGRFTEFFVDEVKERQDLRLIVESYVKTCIPTKTIEDIVSFHLEVRDRYNILSDISGNPPVYSLRTLCRALQVCSNNVCQNMEKSLFESLKITYLQQLNETSILRVMKLLETTVFSKNVVAKLTNMPCPKPKDDHRYVQVQGFWIRMSNEQPEDDDKYIITDSIKENLKSLSRIISLSQRRLPILIQGNTSVGKTSLIMHLARLTGNKCYRINNHEHTDLQEYLGRYVMKENGELVFQKGLLVKAMERGHWIILDELNLAPTELLEALNRALDDNRELYIPEIRETVKAHSKFMLFATQNPPEEYAGRKLLSRAFRNRFIELHFDEIPSSELEVILAKRCEMPPQYAKKIVSVMKDLQIRRRESGCFNGKSGFMTMRDLFRWGERYAVFKNTISDNEFFDWDAHVASEGLVLLEGRVRTIGEAEIVKETIEKIFNRQLDRDQIYGLEKYSVKDVPQFRHISFSREFKRLYVQLNRALKYSEPVLLCGQTGCGKTTACQLYAALNKLNIITYNCHLNTESSDFVGCVRPSRSGESKDNSKKQSFPWVHGPLIEAMKGSVFLIDEISLADDAVLERLNSVLEPTRSIILTEKDGEEIIANRSFRIVATMNPGGDFGKKELSPALRNRFTEIYCHNTSDIDQVTFVVEASLSRSLLKPKIAPSLMLIIRQFLTEYYKDRDIISMRDILSWTEFINVTTNVTRPRPLSIQEAIINGASLVFFDQFGTSGHRGISLKSDTDSKTSLKNYLYTLVMDNFQDDPIYVDKIPLQTITTDTVKFKKFCIQKGPKPIKNIETDFVIDAPIVRKNLMKIVRAMQLNRPILLEGDPGAGKTSVVSALAKLSGHELVRINLSEQTDISDLFGSDLPDATQTDDDTPRFCWHDGPMLSAIKKSHWILLDEMNLAAQSVLEGLNACFDHRGEIFIPELNKRIPIDRTTTRIFACQNPYSQGAARKGLPQSFLNRFTSIYIEPHSDKDLFFVIRKLYHQLDDELTRKLVAFNQQVCHIFKHSGFEFNLRDLLYWCHLITRHIQNTDQTQLKSLFKPERFVQFVYLDRVRTNDERAQICSIFEEIFDEPIYEPLYRDIRLGERSLVIARSILPRNKRMSSLLTQACVLKYQLPYMESVAMALESNKMPILVGEAGVGKRSIVKILAGLTGNDLNIIGANADMDTVELLGSFEQKSLQREIIELIDETKEFVTSMMNAISHKPLASTWSQLFKHVWTTLYATAIRDLGLSKSQLVDAFRFQLLQMKELMSKIKPLATTHVELKYKKLNTKIEKITKKFLFDSDSMYSVGNFEWIDSILIKSVRQGDWVMIENANLLNPATLDRLNSLIELNGSLSLNEKGSNQDGIEVLVPHPNFRLILTMAPQHGELSRAMRNRGVEIFVQPRFYFEDFLMLLYQNGFEPEERKPCMSYCIMETCVEAHKKITDQVAYEHDSGGILSYFALNYIPVLTHQIRRGLDADKVLADLLIGHYNQKGYFDGCTQEIIGPFVLEQMAENRKKYEVNLNDERYQWIHLMHDLVSLTGGDASTATVDKDNQIFFDETEIDNYLKPDEMIENIDIVNTCTTVKIFLELSTHGDFEYRKGFISETFSLFPNLMKTVNNHVELLHGEYLPQINSMLPRSNLIPISETYVDSRNAPDIHYYLSLNDYQGTKTREALQNRWLLSLHRIMLRLIVELIEERSMDVPGNTSLWAISEKYRTGAMLKEDLIRPTAEIVSDLYDLLDGILRTVSNRLFENDSVNKMMARFFWIHYFICKLRKGHSKMELIAICNQLPMLWALTYQKVIVPLIKDCSLTDLVYKNKKFSNRIQHVCDFLDINTTKPGKVEKAYYTKVVNSFASTTKICESVSREVHKFFSMLVGKYIARPQTMYTKNDSNSRDEFRSKVEINSDTLAASTLIWSDSKYISPLYAIEDKLVEIEISEKSVDKSSYDNASAYNAITNILIQKNEEYAKHVQLYQDNSNYRSECLNVNRRRNALDQFSPIWQMVFFQRRLSNIDVNLRDPTEELISLKKILASFYGIMMSPKYYSTLVRFLCKLVERKAGHNNDNNLRTSNSLSRENVDLYTVFLLDHLIEYLVLDSQVVGWTKMRVTTCDLATQAPLIPEYSPLLTLVASYCLDISHLKLNSYESQGNQLKSLLKFLWHNYANIKLELDKDTHDITLARKLLHIRLNSNNSNSDFDKPFGCKHESECQCIETYISKRVPSFRKVIHVLESSLESKETLPTSKAIILVYFGYLTYLEYAPIFTLDPSLRTREKLDVYRAELAHIKLESHFKNILYYWKTGENLNLEDEPENLDQYPFSMRLLVERRIKLEQTVAKLRCEDSNRPKSDDGALYYELRKDVEFSIQRFTTNIQSLMNSLIDYLNAGDSVKQSKLRNLNSKCRMIIKSFEKSILRFRSEYSLYGDLLTNFLVGMCFVQQGLKCLYSKLEQKMQIFELGFASTSTDRFTNEILKVFSFNNLNLGNIHSVIAKLRLFPKIEKLSGPENSNNIQSILLRTVLIQLHHHITITPSDIQRCIPIVCNIADLFHSAWLRRKLYLEEQRKRNEQIYQYKVSRSVLGDEISYERQEFLDLCAKFPTYDHVFHPLMDSPLPSADRENLTTEEKICNLNRSVDLSQCIDICRAHYKFIMEASKNFLGEDHNCRYGQLPEIDISHMVKLEAEVLYSISRHSILSLDSTFDAKTLECHLLQAHRLGKILSQKQSNDEQPSKIHNSIEILDDEHFDIYHCGNPMEALKFQDFIKSLEMRVANIRSHHSRVYDNHPMLLNIIKLTTKISSFLISDPMMKFVTGSHALLERIEQWNSQKVLSELKLFKEGDELVEVIKGWRKVELESWRNSLHLVKRKYIDGSLCDLWFYLYEAFKNPVQCVTKYVRENLESEDFELTTDHENVLYEGFAGIIKNFFEDNATMGDFKLRLDLVFSFAIQSRFTSLHEESRSNKGSKFVSDGRVQVDYEKLTTYVYNVCRQYEALTKIWRRALENEEEALTKELNTEIKLVAWYGRNLWDIKNNFRISHRKLNKVMNKYLEVLKRPIMSLNRDLNISELTQQSQDVNVCESLRQTLQCLSKSIKIIDTSNRSRAQSLISLSNSVKTLEKLKVIYNKSFEISEVRYLDNLNRIEQIAQNNSEAIKNFQSHRVQDVIIDSKDSKETKAEKYKICRQMHHSKLFALQSIFKDLRAIGVSYQRGLNSSIILDRQILSLVPLRGLLLNQSKPVLDSAAELVSNDIITACNNQYREIIAHFTYLMGEHEPEVELTTDQLSRITGLSMDILRDINCNSRDAALVYKDLINLQGVTTRLRQLFELPKNDSVPIYNFRKVHSLVINLNEIVSRALLAIAKVKELCSCYDYISETIPASACGEELASTREGSQLDQLIEKIDSSNSLLTQDQYLHITSQISESHKSIASVSDNLRDMLNNTPKNHLYSYDDLDRLESLHEIFTASLVRLIPCDISVNERPVNCSQNTCIAALIELFDDAKNSMTLSTIRENPIRTIEHSNIDKLNVRLTKLIRLIKLAAQDVYKDETNFKKVSTDGIASESIKRKMKPFNHIDSYEIRKMLRVQQVARSANICFMTLNKEIKSVDIKPIVSELTDILFVYNQSVASYLNIILSSLHLKLASAAKLFTFFIDLRLNGLGLPYKFQDQDDGQPDKSGKLTEDNTGFGEGSGDTDVSKKLEFESQLDELKQNANDKETGENQDDNVEAHDDGVEMSEDIDAEAKGPDDTNEESKSQEEDQEDNSGDQEDELDKELDSVDQDEGRLDENLWDEKDDGPTGEDDEADLKEASADPTPETRPDDKEMQAKDDDLTESKPKAKEDSEPLAKSDEKENDINELPNNPSQDEQELDLEAEAEQAQQPENELESDLSKILDDDLAIDMSLEEDEPETVEDSSNQNDDKNENPKSDGELSDDTNDDLNSQMDDDDIDNKLEVAIDAPQLEEKLDNFIEDQISNISNKTTDQTPSEMKGKMIGKHMLYDVLAEEENDPIDVGDPPAQDSDSNNHEDNHEAANDQRDEHSSRSGEPQKDTKEGVGSGGQETDPMDTESNEKDGADAPDNETESKKRSKRTLAERDEKSDSMEHPKRQKILESQPNQDSMDEGGDKLPEASETKSQSDTSRHIEKDSQSAIEVVDLISSEDECDVENIVDKNNDLSHDTQLRPRMEKPKNPNVNKSELPDVIEIEDLEPKNSDKGGDSKQADEEKESEDNQSFSSISSFEGEKSIYSSSDLEQIEPSQQLKTSYNTNIGLLKYAPPATDNNEKQDERGANLLKQIDHLLNLKSFGPEHDCVNEDQLISHWIECTRSTNHLVHELCQQLQIVLQPTKMSKYKGDYKTGKRLNMRKIISYIASHYRKDKIWLRRTKPSKRTYNISIAVDNSSSMCENNCRQMTYQSLALLARSLSLIEAGSLNVVSFGEQVKCIHEFGQPYVDAIGAHWLRELRFNESRTSYGQLLRYSCESFAKQAFATQSQLQTATSVNQLLVIISDGRNVTSEEDDVKLSLRQLRSQGVLTLFIIIDDLKLNGGNSIVDVKRCLGFGGNLQMVNYMELFPFPFYVLLRQLDTMPSVLGDALRQWFELVSSINVGYP